MTSKIRRENVWAVESMIIILVIGVPLAVAVNTRDSTILKPAIALVAVYLGMWIWLARSLLSGQIVVVKTPLDRPILVYLGLGLLSLLISRHRYFAWRELLRLLTCAGIFFLVTHTLFRRKQVVRVVAILLMVAAVAAGYGLSQYMEFGSPPGGEGKFLRPISTFGNPNYFAGFLAGMIPLTLTSALTWKIWRRSLALAAAILLLVALVTTHTRGAWLAAAVGMLVVALFHRRELIRHPLAVVPVVLVLVIGLILLPKGVWERLATLPHILRDPGAQARLRGWEGAFRAFLNRPILGHGLGSFSIIIPRFNLHNEILEVNHQIVAHAHCEYLELLVEQGVLGLAGFLWVIAVYLRKMGDFVGGAQTRVSRELAIGGLALTVSIVVHNMVSLNLRLISTAFLLWLAMALTMALAGTEGGDNSKVTQTTRSVPRTNIMVKYLIISLGIPIFVLVARDQLSLIRSDRAVFRGDMFLSQGKRREAIEQYGQATIDDRHNLLALYKLAYQQLRDNDLDEALVSYRAIERQAPHYTRLHFYMGLVYREKGERENAIIELEKAAEITDDFDNHFLLAQLHRELGDEEEGLRHLQRAVANSGRSLRLLAERRTAAERHGWRSEGENIPLKLQELRKRVAKAYEELVRHHASRGNWPQAIAPFTAASSDLPDDPMIQTHLALAYERSDLRDEAISGYRRAIQLDPEDSEALAGLGRLATIEDEALELIRRAMDLSPPLKRGTYLEDLASIHFRHRSYELAAEAIHTAIELTAEEDLTTLARRNLLAGIVSLARGEIRRANDAWRTVVQLAPESPWAHTARELLTQLEEDSQGLYRRAAEMDLPTRFGGGIP